MKKFLTTLLVIICIGIIALDCYAVYVYKNRDKHFPLISNYWGYDENSPKHDVKADPDISFTFCINYYENANKNGYEMFEIKLNYYTDYLLRDKYSLGIQIINPSLIEFKSGLSESYLTLQGWQDYYKYYLIQNDANVYYFNTDDGLNFNTTNAFNTKNVPYIINIDNKPFAFDFNKETITEKYVILRHNHYFMSNFNYFLYKTMFATTHITEKNKTYQNLTLEFEDVFNISEYNSESKKFDKQSTYGYSVDYINFKVNYYERGATTHKDSFFGRIGEEDGGVIYA